MGGGAPGGSTNIPLRQPSQEWPTISNWYGHQQGQFNDFVQNQPLLNTAQQGALTNYGNLGQLTDPLMSILGQTPGEFQGLYGQLGQTAGQVGSYARPLEGALQNQIDPVLQSGGALSGAQLRDVNQQTLANASAAGSAFSPGTLGTEAVNAQRERESRFSNYLTMGQNTAGTLGALRGEQAGIYGQQSGLLGQEASTVGGTSSLVQGLQSGGLNQLLGAEQANVGSFTGLENPILSYLSNLYGSNEQASIAQAQVNQQGNIANSGKTGGAIGGGIQAIGSIAGPLIAL